ncbi:hypothetical protein [Chitinophaga deserti]|uniref:hypothetical protein n=1 Tax=Chitinophaga deserti TaxID=2164099 RepID=UPI000D6CBCFA|nr:hypothetical protein [Chitinophaga deserti]
MEPSTSNDISLLISFLSLVSSIALALILYYATKKIETQNFSNTLRDSWIQIDGTILSNERLLIEIDDLLHPNKKSSTIEEKRRRWLCFMIANTLSVNYNGIKHKLLPDPKASEESLIHSLEGLTQHDEFMEIVKYFYEKDFRDFCWKIHDRYKLSIKSVSPDSENNNVHKSKEAIISK